MTAVDPDLSSHAGFIAAAFVATAAVLGGTVLAVLIDGRMQRRALARLAALDPRRAARDGEEVRP